MPRPSPIEPIDAEKFVHAALAEGRHALPACLPNPPVDCVLVRNGVIVARGHTQPPFHHHAEASALAQISGLLDDVTAFVTLEPCSFHGRTPSCAKTMVERKLEAISRRHISQNSSVDEFHEWLKRIEGSPLKSNPHP